MRNLQTLNHRRNSLLGINGFRLICVAVLIEFFFVGATMGLGITSTLLGIAVFAVFSCLAPIESVVLVFLFLLPNQRMAVFDGSNISLLNVGVVILVFRNLSTVFRCPSAFLFYGGLLGALSVVISFSATEYSRIIVFGKVIVEFIMLYLVFSNKTRDSSWFGRCILFFSLGALLLGGIELFRGGAALAERGRLGITEDDFYNNPNMMGNTFAFAIGGLFLLFNFYNLRLKEKAGILLLIGMFITLGVISGSRAFFLAVVALWGGYFLVNISSPKQWKGLAVLFAVAFGIVCVAHIFPNTFLGQIWQNALERIFNPRGGDISGGRFDLWSEYWDIYTSSVYNIFWGASEDRRMLAMDLLPHNAFLTLLVNWGIFGVSLWIIAIFSLFRALYIQLKGIYGNPSVVGMMLFGLIVLFAMTRTNLFDMTTIAQMFCACFALFIKKFHPLVSNGVGIGGIKVLTKFS